MKFLKLAALFEPFKVTNIKKHKVIIFSVVLKIIQRLSEVFFHRNIIGLYIFLLYFRINPHWIAYFPVGLSFMRTCQIVNRYIFVSHRSPQTGS